jgi:hypothetical protein
MLVKKGHMPQSKQTVVGQPISSSFMIVRNHGNGLEPVGHFEYVGNSVIFDAVRDVLKQFLEDSDISGPLEVLDLHSLPLKDAMREKCNEPTIKSYIRPLKKRL